MTALAAADIAPIPEGASRFDHVRKHLYCTKERWDLIVPTLPRAPKDVARQHGCPDFLRLGYHEACDSCRAHVLGDHDRFYEPAYREALVTAIAAKRCGALPQHSRRSVLYLGDNGVVVAVNKAAGRHQVGTAYRVALPGAAKKEQTAEAFFRAAERKFRDKLGGR